MLIMLTGVLLLGMIGCTRPGPPPAWQTPSPTGTADYAGPAAPRLRLSEVWHRDRAELKSVAEVSKIGPRLVLRGSDADDRGTIMIIDAATGAVLWDDTSLPAELSTGLGPVGPGSGKGWADGAWAADDGRGGVLILAYHLKPCADDPERCQSSRVTRTAGHGLVAVSLTDRSVRWTSEIIPSRDRDREDADPEALRLKQRVIGVSVSVIIAMTSTAAPGRDPGLATIAVDPVTGQELWRTEQLLPSAVEGDRVLALASPTEIGTGTPVVLDARSGSEIVRLPDRDAAWSAIGDGLATITRTRGDEPEPPPVIELADGRTVLDLPRSPLGSLVLSRSATGPVAWWYDDEVLLTQSAGDLAPLRASPPDTVEPGALLSARGDYAWAETPQGQLALDRTGQIRSDPLPDSAQLIGNDLILVDGFNGKPGLTLLRIA